MTRRRIERELEKVSEELLEGLGTAQRLREYLRVRAGPNPGQASKLDVTAPRESHSMRDPEYVTQRLATNLVATRARAALHVALLRYRWGLSARACLALSGDEEALEEGSQEPELLAHLAATRLQYTEFAEDEFDCTLRELLAGDPKGEEVLAAVDQVLVERREQLVEEPLFALVENLAESNAIDAPSMSDISTEKLGGTSAE